ncbi:MAG: YegS/Rv2252/BmrU family lipid kinase [Clostridia bacterium]|nr:YegS/Rv2252/BmrU family lipid kinase [Clostridia bacterium]
MNGEQTKNKILLVYNPKSGNGLFKNNLDKIIRSFQDIGMMVQPVRADNSLKLEEVLSNLDDSYRKVIAAGGDGTINVVVNCMVKSGCDLPLAIFPAGTANDFASYFNIPTGIDGMISIALEDHYVPVDVGKYNDRYFVNVAAIGSVIDVSQKTETGMKNALGIMAYYLKALTEIPSLKPVPITVKTPEREFTESIFFMVVLNGNSAGGFRNLGAHSSINDGLLDVIMFKGVNFIRLPMLLMSVLQGRHDENDNVIYFQTEKIHIESDIDVSTDIDGEVGEPLPLDIELLPKKLLVNVSPYEQEQELSEEAERCETEDGE